MASHALKIILILVIAVLLTMWGLTIDQSRGIETFQTGFPFPVSGSYCGTTTTTTIGPNPAGPNLCDPSSHINLPIAILLDFVFWLIVVELMSIVVGKIAEKMHKNP